MNNYRPDIDGLRAISVLLVLFFHANLFGIQAGFIGVDIFFVISGFLITTGIKNGLEAGTFSFCEFFNRRLWRLQPVFISLLLVTILITTLTYLPNDYLNFTKSAQYATWFQANYYFSGLESGYFADDTSVMPLLHTWSLSIEWQWYLVLPFLMSFFYRIIKVKDWGRWIVPLTIIAIILPFYFIIPAYFTEDNGASRYYYSFISRIFEMLIGACLVVIGGTNVDKIPTVLKTALGLSSLVFIFCAAFNSNIATFYPNWWAVGVCLSGALLIYIGSGEKTNFITELLSFKPLVLIGVLSYSLYIWHWPVFAFIRNLAIEETALVVTAALAASFIFAWLSYRFVENKFRKKYVIPFHKSLLILVILPCFLVVILDRINGVKKGFPNRFPALHFANSINDEYEITKKKRLSCILAENPQGCFVGLENANKKAIMLGDSHANHAWGFIDVLAKDSGMSVELKSISTCLELPNITSDYNTNVECLKKTEADYKKLTLEKYDFVIIGQFWQDYLHWGSIEYNDRQEKTTNKRDVIFLALDNGLSRIEKLGITPVVIREIQPGAKKYNERYPYEVDAKSCVEKQFKLYKIKSNKCDFMDYRKIDDDQKYLDHLFTEMQAKYPTLIVINLSDIQCQNGVCRTEINDYPIYSDKGSHLTDYASYKFGKEYLEKYGNPFKQ